MLIVLTSWFGIDGAAANYCRGGFIRSAFASSLMRMVLLGKLRSGSSPVLLNNSGSIFLRNAETGFLVLEISGVAPRRGGA